MIYNYDEAEAAVRTGAITRHEADLLHGYSEWLGDNPRTRPREPTEDELLAYGRQRREGNAGPYSSPADLLARGDNRHAAWRLVYAARGDDYPGHPAPGDDRLEALVDQLHRDGWHR